MHFEQFQHRQWLKNAAVKNQAHNRKINGIFLELKRQLKGKVPLLEEIEDHELS